MEKQIFKKGDRVFDIRFGWGTVVDDDNNKIYPIGIQFDNDDSQEVIFYTGKGMINLREESSLLSFKEYGLDDRFTQERPINYNDYVGKWGVFWDKRFNGYYISKLKEIDVNNGFTEFVDSDSGKWDKFRPLTDEQIKILKSCD